MNLSEEDVTLCGCRYIGEAVEVAQLSNKGVWKDKVTSAVFQPAPYRQETEATFSLPPSKSCL